MKKKKQIMLMNLEIDRLLIEKEKTMAPCKNCEFWRGKLKNIMSVNRSLNEENKQLFNENERNKEVARELSLELDHLRAERGE